MKPGDSLGPYRVVSELGVGGMGEVYRARDTRLDRDVAIKVLPAATSGDPHARERLRVEAMAAAGLDHPYICKVFELAEHGPTRFLVMEYVDGETLHERLRASRIPFAEALRIAAQMADALEVAHARGVVHRDLKPGNVMLTPQGHVKIMDFGLARRAVDPGMSEAETREGAPPLTAPGTVLGTPGYMSPEQEKGLTVDARSDQFAFGVVLAEMFGGRHPFRRPSAAETCAAVLHEPPDLPADVPDAVTEVLRRLLAKKAVDRYPSTTDVRAAVNRLQATPAASGPDRQAPPPSRTGSAKSMAVLPFVNVSPSADDEFFSDGLTDELITDLSGVKALRLVSRNSSMQMKGTAKPVREIGRELGVQYLLTGTVRRAGSALRITAQLVDASTDTPLWAEKYSGTMDDVFDVQERVSRAIVGALAVQLTSSEEARLGERRISDPRAFELYLQARSELRRYGASTDRAEELLRHAIQIEGETPPLRALRAFIGFSKVRGGSSTDSRLIDTAEAEAYALVELVPDAPYGHALLGFVSYERGRLPEAARHLTRALDLDPTDADVLFMLCITLQAGGQIRAAQQLSSRFAEVDPLSPFAGAMLCVSEWFSGNIGLHVDALERSTAMDPENPILNWALGYTYALMGRTADAADRAAWMRRQVPHLPYTAQLSSLVDAVEGRREAALETLATVDASRLDAHHTFHLAESYAMARETARALELLERAVDGGMYPYRFYAEFCPFTVPLRGLPEFERIVARAARRVADFHA